jgi:putative redox protein
VTLPTVARWIGGLGFLAQMPNATTVSLSSAKADQAPKPSELLLAALAGCTGMDVISICVKKRQAIERYEVRVTAEQRETHPRTFESMVVEHVFAGDRIDDSAIFRAIHLSATRYCLVSAHLCAGDTTIRHSFSITDAGGTRSADVLVTGPYGAGLDADRPPGDASSAALELRSGR